MSKRIDIDRLEQTLQGVKNYIDSKEPDLSGIEERIDYLYDFYNVPTDFDGLQLFFDTAGNIDIGMAGRNGGTSTYGLSYNWDIYLNGEFKGNYTGTTATNGVISIANSRSGVNVITMVCKLANTDYCARSVNFFGADSVGSYDKLVGAKGYGNAFNGTSEMPSYCYYYMLRKCTALEVAPELPALTVGNYGYAYMFSGCTALEVAPELPALTVGNYSYASMFSGCTALEVAPDLPASTVGYYGYQYMFYGCTALKNSSTIYASKLEDHTCYYMFDGCTNLIYANNILATEAGYNSCRFMFRGCINLLTGPEIFITTITSMNTFSLMFDNCTKLTSVKMHYASNLTSTQADRWLINVFATGICYSPNAVITYGLPSTWTAQPL